MKAEIPRLSIVNGDRAGVERAGLNIALYLTLYPL
jgi:hypothetical protein